MALVKKLPGAKETEDDILKFLQTTGVDTGKITKWMLPVYVAFVDEIPKTSVGKFDKIAVRKRIDEFLAKAKRVRLIWNGGCQDLTPFVNGLTTANGLTPSVRCP
jgi:hypothetical protein